MRKRWIKVLLFIFLTPILLLCAFLLFERIRGQIALAHYKRELIAKGEKLTFKELIPPTPEGENGAPEVQQAVERLQEGAVMPNNAPPAMQLTPAGHAVVGFRENVWVNDMGFRDGEWISGKLTNTWAQLAEDLKTNKATLAEIQAALAKPILNNDLDYSQGTDMRFNLLVPDKQLSFWFGAAAELALHEGKPNEALDNLIAQASLPRLLVDDYLAISELVRIAIASIAKNSTWEAVQADGWTDEGLARLQEVWAHENFVGSMARSLEGERVFGLVSSEQMRGSNQAAYDTMYWQAALAPFWADEPERDGWREAFSYLPESAKVFTRKQVYCRLWRFSWSHQEEHHYLEAMQTLLEIVRGAGSEKSLQKITPLLDDFAETASTKTFYDRLRFPSSSQSLAVLARVINRAMRAETERSITVCAIALKRYSIRHGIYPASLDTLVPEFLSAVPIDYMDGKPLKYRLNDDGSYILYSVGEDGRDDGGDTSLLPDKNSYRNLWNRTDFVWPVPATPEEVEAWRKEEATN